MGESVLLPTPQLTILGDGICLLLPLSHRGSGPGLIILNPSDNNPKDDLIIRRGHPSPLVKWAEESFTVVQIQSSALQANKHLLDEAISALSSCATVNGNGKYGLVVYDATTFIHFQSQFASAGKLAGVVIYTDSSSGIVETSLPSVQHLAGKPELKLPRTPQITAYSYPLAETSAFALPDTAAFNYNLDSVSHTRNLTFLKKDAILGGPTFDLETLWDEHCYYEFADRNVEKTMATMVQEPYVNNIPTLTGGIGRELLTDFYAKNFIFSNPDDAEIELVSRTVGIDRVIDEFVFRFTHVCDVGWILPGIPPTGRKLEVPMMAIVNFRGDRLYHEHISWDQATVLRQIGLLPEYLSWPASLGKPDQKYIDTANSGQQNGSGEDTKLVARVPAAGREAAAKLRDKDAIASNGMLSYKMTYAGRE